MSSVEIFGVLFAGSIRYHEAAGRCSSAGVLSRAELAGLLAGLSGPEMDLGYAKYGLDLEAERKLVAHVRVYAAGVAVREGWKIIRGRPTVVNMAAIAVFENVRPNRCGRCVGRGFRAHRVCTSCNGSGVKALSGREIGSAMGVDDWSYRHHWRSRYQGIFEYVQGLDLVVNRRLYLADKICKCSEIKNG